MQNHVRLPPPTGAAKRIQLQYNTPLDAVAVTVIRHVPSNLSHSSHVSSPSVSYSSTSRSPPNNPTNQSQHGTNNSNNENEDSNQVSEENDYGVQSDRFYSLQADVPYKENAAIEEAEAERRRQEIEKKKREFERRLQSRVLQKKKEQQQELQSSYATKVATQKAQISSSYSLMLHHKKKSEVNNRPAHQQELKKGSNPDPSNEKLDSLVQAETQDSPPAEVSLELEIIQTIAASQTARNALLGLSSVHKESNTVDVAIQREDQDVKPSVSETKPPNGSSEEVQPPEAVLARLFPSAVEKAHGIRMEQWRVADCGRQGEQGRLFDAKRSAAMAGERQRAREIQIANEKAKKAEREMHRRRAAAAAAEHTMAELAAQNEQKQQNILLEQLHSSEIATEKIARQHELMEQRMIQTHRSWEALRHKLIRNLGKKKELLEPFCLCGRSVLDNDIDACAVNCEFKHNRAAYNLWIRDLLIAFPISE